MSTKLISIQFEMEEVFCWHPRYLMGTKEEYWPAERICENAKLGGNLTGNLRPCYFQESLSARERYIGMVEYSQFVQAMAESFSFLRRRCRHCHTANLEQEAFLDYFQFFFYLKGDVSWQLKRKIDVTV